MARNYTVQLKDGDLKVSDSELSVFAEEIGISGDLRSRVCELFILDAFVYATVFDVNPSDIVIELNNLENGDGNTSTKPATQFKHAPLAGLWHKHFFCTHFIGKNILNELRGNKMQDFVDNALDESQSSKFTPEMIAEFAHRIVNEPINKRADDKRLTGEWIVFAKHEGKNYYLCLNTHEAGDPVIANRIRERCAREFEFVTNSMVPDSPTT